MVLSLSNKIIDKTSTLEKEGLRENSPKYLILHSTYRSSFEDVLRSHKLRGFAGGGYHLFVADSSEIYQFRPFNLEGAHALGFNLNSIGLCFYTNEGKISEDIEKNTTKTIEYLKELFPTIEILSHTQAQLIYLNKLLKEAKIDKIFPTNIQVTEENFFSKIKSEANSFINYLQEFNSPIKFQIKRLKNCPGEIYKKFI